MAYYESSIATIKHEAARVVAAIAPGDSANGVRGLMSMAASNGHPGVGGSPHHEMGMFCHRTMGLSFVTGVEIELLYPQGKDEAAKGILMDLFIGSMKDPSTHWKLKPGRRVTAERYGCFYEVCESEGDSLNWKTFRRYQAFKGSTIKLLWPDTPVVGSLVRIDGLRSRVDLNGKTAYVRGWNGEGENGRWVLLVGCAQMSEPIRVKPENVSGVYSPAFPSNEDPRDRVGCLEIIRPCDGGYNSPYNMRMTEKEIVEHLNSLPKEERQPLVYAIMVGPYPDSNLLKGCWQIAIMMTEHANSLGWDGFEAKDAVGNVIDIGRAMGEYGEQLQERLGLSNMR